MLAAVFVAVSAAASAVVAVPHIDLADTVVHIAAAAAVADNPAEAVVDNLVVPEAEILVADKPSVTEADIHVADTGLGLAAGTAEMQQLQLVVDTHTSC